MKSETLNLVLVNLASIMQRADESLLPGVYKEVGEDLKADPTALGSLTLFRSLVQSLCYPLAAYLATRHNRAHVIALGAFLWAAATFLVAISSTFLQVLTLHLPIGFNKSIHVFSFLDHVKFLVAIPSHRNFFFLAMKDSSSHF